MSYKYTYSREIVNDAWNIDNPARVDQEGSQIYLSQEIGEALPNMLFKLFCAGSVVDIIFDNELTEGQKSTLDTVVSNHKNNT